MKDIARIVGSMLSNPIRNYATPGLSSFLVGADGPGCIRLFTSDRDTREWVTPHSHRFDFACLVLEGQVENILFEPAPAESPHLGNRYAVGELRQVDGGLGKYEVHRTNKREWFVEDSTVYVAGQSYSMKAEELHSIRFSRGSQVLFFEGPEIYETSLFLEPVCGGVVVPTFETKPWMFKQESG